MNETQNTFTDFIENQFSKIPKWRDFSSDASIKAKKSLTNIRKKLDTSIHRSESFSWNPREGSFWTRSIGTKYYKHISEATCRARQIPVEDLENAIDIWNDYIRKQLNNFKTSSYFNEWQKNVLNRDQRKCVDCGKTNKDIKIYAQLIYSLSEKIAEHHLSTQVPISKIDVSKDKFFYSLDNGVSLCPECADAPYPELLVDIRFWKATNTYYDIPNRQKEYFKHGEVLREITDKLNDFNFKDSGWFDQKMSELEALEVSMSDSDNGRNSGTSLYTKTNVCFRKGEYLKAKRYMMRNEDFEHRRLDYLRQERAGATSIPFKQRNWQPIFDELYERLIARYREGDFSIPYYSIYAQYPNDAFNNLHRDCENEIRIRMGVPLIGEGWISETELFYRVKELYPSHEIVHHSRPSWLGRQEYDIYFTDLCIAIEYMGLQHYEPVDYFGGEDGFKKIKELDEKKRVISSENNVEIVYVKYDEPLDAKSIKNKIDPIVESKKRMFG